MDEQRDEKDGIDRDVTEVRTLEDRVALLEQIVVRIVTLATAVLIVAGTALPFLTSPDESASILSGISLIGGGDSSGVVLLGIGFLGLTACSLAALVTLLALSAAEEQKWAPRTGRILTWLLAVGAGVVSFLALEPLFDGGRGASPAPGLAIYIVGVVGFALVFTSRFRRLWQPRSSGTGSDPS